MNTSDYRPIVGIETFRSHIVAALEHGGRLACLTATAIGDDTLLVASLADNRETLHHTATKITADQPSYPSLTDVAPAALWYEREVHDLFGLTPIGHPRLDPLVLNRSPDAAAPRPGSSVPAPTPSQRPVEPAPQVTGEGVFIYPHGPVRSGAVEAIEYDIETPGEDIPYPQIRVYYKHRGVQKRFEGLTVDDAILLAERVEGIAGVAHAIAFAQAVEAVHLSVIPVAAERVRIIYAELERIANHLDAAQRICDAAALAVATTRLSWHKERVLRLISACCGSRFGRGVVLPGGVSSLPDLPPQQLRAAIETITSEILRDADAVMQTPSLLDRIRGTGVLSPQLAAQHGAVGPIGRASGAVHDVRQMATSPYAELRLADPPCSRDGDAQARLAVRWSEIAASRDCLYTAIDLLDSIDPDSPLTMAMASDLTGMGESQVEAPQGELIYQVDLADGRLLRCRPRTASFHNLPLFHAVFAGDILTDFAFIEASFGLSPAGVAL